MLCRVSDVTHVGTRARSPGRLIVSRLPLTTCWGTCSYKKKYENDEKTIKDMLPSHGQKDGDVYDTGLKVVVPDEGSPLKPEMFCQSIF